MKFDTPVGHVTVGYGFVRAYRYTPDPSPPFDHGSIQIGSIGIPTNTDRHTSAEIAANMADFHSRMCAILSDALQRPVCHSCNGYYAQ
jgi:hypothetical protein